MTQYFIGSVEIKDQKILDRIHEVERKISKMGFSSVKDYGVFFGHKNGIDVLNDFNIHIG